MEDEELLRRAASEQARDQVRGRGYDLRTEDVVEMASRVDRMGAVKYLVDPLWPSDAYGVLAAQDKAGKTWASLDMAVSVASGTPWMGKFPTEQGIAIVYCGEGGARNIIRRLRAIAESKGVAFGTLRGSLRVSERAPHLKKDEQLMTVREEAVMYGPSLIIIDPLYLAALGAKGSDLYAMGETLTGIQEVAQDTGAALQFTHHWNKTGVGTGAQRMTGVGPGAWGRVLGSGSVEEVERDGDKSVVTVEWEFSGSEIPSTVFTAVRTVWADDLHDLTSPLHYEVEVEDGFAKVVRDAARLERLLKWLNEHPGSSGAELERELGIAARRALPEYEKAGFVKHEKGPKNAKLWSSV